MQRFGKWLLTETGHSFSMGLGIAATVTAFGVHYIPNTFAISWYEDVVHLYKNGMTVPLSEKLLERYRKAVDLCEIPKEEQIFYKPFKVYGFDVFNAGSSFSKFGSRIGIPEYYEYTKVREIDKHNIKLKGESVTWDLPEAESLLDSLILSENAQLFGIAREIKMTRTPKLLLDTLFAVTACLGTYGFCTILNKRLNFLAKPRFLRFVMYGLVSSLLATNYCFAKDLAAVHYESKVDEELKAIGPVFVEGGREFYAKLLQRNRAFRALLGTEGETEFTVTGNFNYLLRQKHLPLVHRHKFFESNSNVMEL